MKLVVDVRLRTDVAGDQIAEQRAKAARGGLRAAARDLFVEPERVAHLAPRRRVIRILQVSSREQLKMLRLILLRARSLEPRDRDGDQALRPRAQQLLVRSRRRLGGDRIPAVGETVRPDLRIRRSRQPPALVDQEIPNRLLEIRPERPFVGIGAREETPGQDDSLEEPLRQIVDVGGASVGLPALTADVSALRRSVSC